jgi:hypothetical protein
MPGSISYTRQFSHKDWIDFVDSVQAGGTNGVNGRFHAIEAEFDAISAVIAQIATALQTPVITPKTLTLSPTLAAGAAQPWQQQIGFVSTAVIVGSPSTMATTATGFMPITLPNGATLQGLRVTGQSAGGILLVTVQSQSLATGSTTTLLQVFNNFAATASPTPFDLPPAPQNASFTIDNTANKYLLVAQLQGGNPALAAGGTTLNVFQITYSST